MRRFLLLAALAGCVPTSYAYTPASKRTFEPKAESCSFEILSSPPEELEEIGFLEHYNGEQPKNPDEFRAAIAKQVCRVGGDAVVATADDKGRYTKGTIIRYTRRPAPAM